MSQSWDSQAFFRCLSVESGGLRSFLVCWYQEPYQPSDVCKARYLPSLSFIRPAVGHLGHLPPPKIVSEKNKNSGLRMAHFFFFQTGFHYERLVKLNCVHKTVFKFSLRTFWQAVNTHCGIYETVGTYSGMTICSVLCVFEKNKKPSEGVEKSILKPLEKYVQHIPCSLQGRIDS